ncbi:tyrosine-protein phosphatase [Candidatus Dependentiae bacterium]|nr:tyrosine-protein phosphatase [Candidatus Dependentiae bacterium]
MKYLCRVVITIIILSIQKLPARENTHTQPPNQMKTAPTTTNTAINVTSDTEKVLYHLLKGCLTQFRKNGLQAALDEFYVLAHNHIFPEDNFFPVQEGHLYRCRQLSGQRFAHYIDKFGIKTIINLRGVESRPTWWQEEIAVSRKKNVNHYDIHMDAKVMTPKSQLLELLYIYDNAPRPILIHCKSGADRTGEAAAIWVLDQMGRSNTEAARQLAVDFGHSPGRFPAKDFLIKIWQNRQWLIREYNPSNYPQFARSGKGVQCLQNRSITPVVITAQK